MNSCYTKNAMSNGTLVSRDSVKWHEASAECHFGAKKTEGPSKIRDFVQGTILNP